MTDKNDSMTGITGGASLLSRAPLTGQRHNTQSKFIRAQLAPNPLIAASAPLIAIGTQLSQATSAPNQEQLKKTLDHEIKAFENRAHQLEQRAQTILAARYLLCCYLDDVILQSPWNQEIDWQHHTLLNSFQHEQYGDERFFVILDRAAEDAKHHIDLLELGYLCLNLGYQGKFRQQDNGQGFSQLLDNLHELIRETRGDFSRQLLITSKKHQPTKPLRLRLPSIWMTVLATIIILIAIFMPYHYRAKDISEPVFQHIQLLEQPQTTHLNSRYIELLRDNARSRQS